MLNGNESVTVTHQLPKTVDPLRLSVEIDCPTDLGDGTTSLKIVHSGWERLGTEGATWRGANTDGWNAMLPGFIAAAEL